MSPLRILLFGSAPLPEDSQGIRDAGGIRTDMFDTILRQNGHTIFSFLITKNTDENDKNDTMESSVLTVSRDDPQLFRKAHSSIKTFKPDIVIGVNLFPSFVATQVLPRNIPFWADLNGWGMAEAQGQAEWTNSNAIIPLVWRQERAVLDRCDKISTVSTAQKYGVYGELASRGRLRKETWKYPFVESIPNTMRWFSSDRIAENMPPLFRGKEVPEEAIVLAFVGGYNAWCDTETLFEGVESAMKKNPLLHFVSTGGKIEGVASAPFEDFLKRIEGSPHKNRFHFLGWIPTKDIARVYKESDMGLNADILCLETETGARNRLNEMMKFGLPIVTTSGSEIANIVKNATCGKSVESGNSEAFASAILEIAESTGLRQEFAKNGEQIMFGILAPENVLKGLIKWTQAPTLSPDSSCLPLNVDRLSFFTSGLQYFKTYGFFRTLRKGVQFFSHSFFRSL